MAEDNDRALVAISGDVHRQLKIEAAKRGITMQALAEQAILSELRGTVKR